jgi:hypothetical protein
MKMLCYTLLLYISNKTREIFFIILFLIHKEFWIIKQGIIVSFFLLFERVYCAHKLVIIKYVIQFEIL